MLPFPFIDNESRHSGKEKKKKKKKSKEVGRGEEGMKGGGKRRKIEAHATQFSHHTRAHMGPRAHGRCFQRRIFFPSEKSK